MHIDLFFSGKLFVRYVYIPRCSYVLPIFFIETDSLLFKSVSMPVNCLHDLLPPYKALHVKPRDTQLL